MGALDGGEFVRQLEIEVLGTNKLWRGSFSGALSEADQPPRRTAYVAAASVVSFAEGVGGQQREDLLNSTLLAQLAANHRADRERDTIRWYEAYREVLRGVGWQSGRRIPRFPSIPRGAETSLTTGRPGPTTQLRPQPPLVIGASADPGRVLPMLQFIRHNTAQQRFTASEAIVATLTRTAGAEAAVLTRTALDTLRGLGDRDRRVVIFESSSHSAGRGNFQIVSATCGPDLILRMTLLAVFFATDENVPRLMSFSFGSIATQIFQARDTMVLAPADYEGAREQVIQQLGDQAAAYIAEIPIDGQS